MRRAWRKCPICDNDQVDVLHSQRFELMQGHPLANGYDVVVCDSCGFVYADTVVTQADYDRFYTQMSKYADNQTATGGGENPWDRKRLQETAHQIVSFLKDSQISIVDVGCANGGLLKELKELGCENLCGIDPSSVCVENTRQLGLSAYPGSLSQPFTERTFDVIILSHTLEHVLDLQSALRWIKYALNPSGRVYLEVPDATRYADFLYAPFQDFNTEHINHFSLACLENTMRCAGFTMLASAQKILQTGAQTYYPAMYGFWKLGDGISHASCIVKDHTLRLRIEQYIRHSRDILDRIQTQLVNVLKRSPQVIVWGTGQLTMKLLVETPLANAEILAFVDNNPINQGRMLRGVPILSPDKLGAPNAPIIISTLLHQQEIVAQIKRMRLANEIILLTE